jgi:outer membrane protein
MSDRLLIPLLLCLLPTVAGAQEPLTLQKAMALGLERNLSIQIAGNQSDVVKNLAKPGNANLLPKVDLNGGATYSYNSSSQTFSNPAIPAIDTSGAATGLNASLGFSYVLFDGLGNFRNYRRLRLNGDMSELDERMQVEATVMSVATTYLSALRAQQSASNVRRSLEVSLQRLERARRRAEYGSGTRTEVLNAELYVNQDSATLADAEYMARRARRDLLALIMLPEEEAGPVDNMIALGTMPAFADLQEGAEANSAALILGALSVERAENDVRINRSLAFPVLAINGSYGYSRTTSDVSIFKESSNLGFNGGITLSYNLFDGRKKRTQLQNAKLALETDKLRLEQSRTEVMRNLANGYDNWQTAMQRMALRTRNLDVARQNVQRSEELYNLGQLTGLEYRDAQLSLLRSELDILDSRVQAKLAELDLLRLSGRLMQEE